MLQLIGVCKSYGGFTLHPTDLAIPAGQTTANCLHPGVVSTKLLVDGFGMHGSDSVEEGAATSVFLATAPQVEGVTGRYFVRSREASPAPQALDAGARRITEKMKVAAAEAIFSVVGNDLAVDHIVPSALDPRVGPAVAAAVAAAVDPAES